MQQTTTGVAALFGNKGRPEIFTGCCENALVHISVAVVQVLAGALSDMVKVS